VTATGQIWRPRKPFLAKINIRLSPYRRSVEFAQYEGAQLGSGGTQPLTRPKHDFCRKLWPGLSPQLGRWRMQVGSATLLKTVPLG
jgi:hypothetical protein